MPDKRDTQSGISLRDVSELFTDVGRQFAGDIHCRITVPMRQGSGLLFWVHVVFEPRTLAVGSVRTGCTKSGRWPTSEHSTLAGLLFRLCYEVASELDGRVEEEKRATLNQRRML